MTLPVGASSPCPFADLDDPTVIASSALPGGGGGGSSAVFAIGTAPTGGLALEDAVAAILEWDEGDLGGAFDESRGDMASWSDLDPTVITIAETGYYDLEFMAFITPGTNEAALQAAPKVNGVLHTFAASFAPVCYSKITAAAPADTCWFHCNSIALEAGDEVEVQINQTGNAANDTEVAYAAIRIARRA